MRFFVGLLVAFGLGFLVHAFFFPDVWYNGLAALTKKNIEVKSAPVPQNSNEQFFTYVTYQDGKFRPGKVTIKRSNYLAVTNLNAKEFMWLVSDNSLLNTNRNYAESERLTVLLNELGTFTVVEKNRPEALLTVSVIP